MRGTPRLLLLYPGQLSTGEWGRVIELKPHMVYLNTFLRDFFDVTVLDLENELGRPESEAAGEAYRAAALDKVLGVDAEVVGISCWSSLNYLASSYFATEIKKRRPHTRVIAGGYHPTLVPEDFQFPGSPFDDVVQGEMFGLLDLLGVPRAEGMPDRSCAIHPDYRAYPYYRSQKAAGVFLGNGCPFTCSFCMEYKRSWGALPAASAVELLLRLATRDAFEYVMIFDACFGLDRRWRKELLRGLVASGLDSYLWFETRVDLLDDEDLELIGRLKAKVDFGVDSFSPSMLRIMRKTRHPERYLERFVRVSERCSSLGILHDAFLVLNHPGETARTFDECMTFVEERVVRALGGGSLRLSGQSYAYFPGSHVALDREHYRRTYGTRVLVPEWWRMPGDHAALARYVIPSTSESGEPFVAPLADISTVVSTFNARSREPELWRRLKSFGC